MLTTISMQYKTLIPTKVQMQYHVSIIPIKYQILKMMTYPKEIPKKIPMKIPIMIQYTLISMMMMMTEVLTLMLDVVLGLFQFQMWDKASTIMLTTILIIILSLMPMRRGWTPWIPPVDAIYGPIVFSSRYHLCNVQLNSHRILQCLQ